MDYSKDANTKKQKDKKSTKKKVGNRIGIILIRILIILIILLCFAVLGAGMGAYFGIIGNSQTVDLELIQAPKLSYTSFIYDQNGVELTSLHGTENREYVKLDQIPKSIQNATIAIEDVRFYSHNGVDFRGIARAMVENVKSLLGQSDRLEGASTITQQLIKINFFKDALTSQEENKVVRKLQEQYMAVELEKKTAERAGSKKAGKDEILELYLNTINYGSGAYGVQAASKFYFGKDVSELTLAESATLAAIPQNPTKWNPKNHPDNNKIRKDKVLRDMKEQEYITENQYREAMNEDVYSKIQSVVQQVEEESSTRSYYEDQVIAQVIEDLQTEKGINKAQANSIVWNQGVKITACIDRDIQAIVDEAYQNPDLFPKNDYGLETTYYITVEDKATKQQHNYNERSDYLQTQEEVDQFLQDMRAKYDTEDVNVIAERHETVIEPQSAFVITDYHTGQVKAVIGGRGDKLANRTLNRATQSTRQPGSTFKVLAAYAPGIDTGVLTAASVFDDAPYKKGKWAPQNWYSGYRGISTVRRGIEYSMNIVAAKAIDKVGIGVAMDYLQNFGFTTLETDPNKPANDLNDTTVLGGITNGVILNELNSAYGTIANGGGYMRPIFYTKVVDHDGKVILENNQEPKPVLKETTAFILTDMMEDVITGSMGTAKSARFRNIKMPIAGKTGTTSDNKDLLFSGYTPYYVASVWLGHDYKRSLKENGNQHIILWRNIMEDVHQQKGLEYKNFERPEGIITMDVCNLSGKLPGPACGSHVISEYFTKGTEPISRCYSHSSIRIDTSTNLLATKYCPEEFVEEIYDAEGYDGDIPNRYCDVHTADESASDESNSDESSDESDESSSDLNEQTSSTKQTPPVIATDNHGNIVESETTTMPNIQTTVPHTQENTLPATEDFTVNTEVPTPPDVAPTANTDIPINNDIIDTPPAIDNFFSPN